MPNQIGATIYNAIQTGARTVTNSSVWLYRTVTTNLDKYVVSHITRAASAAFQQLKKAAESARVFANTPAGQGVLGGIVVIGVGYLGYRYVKNRNAAAEKLEKQAQAEADLAKSQALKDQAAAKRNFVVRGANNVAFVVAYPFKVIGGYVFSKKDMPPAPPAPPASGTVI